MIYHELKEIAGKHNESLKTAMRILKGLKLSKDRDAWKLKNAMMFILFSSQWGAFACLN